MNDGHDLITLHEAATELGVHYMTAYRYVRTGRLPGVKDGAQWRVRRADLTRVRSSATTTRPPTGAARRAYPVRLEDRLLAGDEPGAWSIVENAMASGVEPASIYLDLLAAVLQSIGDRWEIGEVSVADEHQASAVALRLIGRLGPRFSRRGRKRGSIVLGAPPQDHHSVPVALLTDLLRGQGFRVYDLGDDVPTESFVDVARSAERLIAVGVSCTTGGNERNISRAVRALKEAVARPVIVGGGAITDADQARRLGADGWAPRAPEALRLFDELQRHGHVIDPTAVDG